MPERCCQSGTEAEGGKERERERERAAAAAVAAATRGLINSEEQHSPSRVICSHPAALSPCLNAADPT